MKNLNSISRIILALGSLSVLSCFWLPLWEIKLWAPQYPEGLSIEIWHNALKGDVEVINGLNHYIGMKHLKAEMFPEFTYLKFIISAFVIWGLFIAYKGNMKWLGIYISSMIIGGIIALLDFYRWGYDYGHHLDPSAPIQVPGMAYQPPVIGYKDLLNFTALSIPSTGGWIIVALGAFSILLFIFEKFKKNDNSKPIQLILLFLSIGAVMSSCGNKKKQIDYGKVDCDFCKMKIMDSKFGILMLSNKGRKYQFDDINCMMRFQEENAIPAKEIHCSAFDFPAELIPVDQAKFIQSEQIKTPMGSGIAAFKDMNNASTQAATYQTAVLSWNEITQK